MRQDNGKDDTGGVGTGREVVVRETGDGPDHVIREGPRVEEVREE